MFKVPDRTKCISLDNQPSITKSTLINLNANECSQDLCYYPFLVKTDRSNGSFNAFNDLANRICVPNKTEDINLHVFNMTTGIDESKTIPKHISCDC